MSRVPKQTFIHIECLQLSVNDAVTCFNKGNDIKMNVRENLAIDLGLYAKRL